jgi:hypothetical protein
MLSQKSHLTILFGHMPSQETLMVMSDIAIMPLMLSISASIRSGVSM